MANFIHLLVARRSVVSQRSAYSELIVDQRLMDTPPTMGPCLG